MLPETGLSWRRNVTRRISTMRRQSTFSRCFGKMYTEDTWKPRSFMHRIDTVYNGWMICNADFFIRRRPRWCMHCRRPKKFQICIGSYVFSQWETMIAQQITINFSILYSDSCQLGWVPGLIVWGWSNETEKSSTFFAFLKLELHLCLFFLSSRTL